MKSWMQTASGLLIRKMETQSWPEPPPKSEAQRQSEIAEKLEDYRKQTRMRSIADEPPECQGYDRDGDSFIECEAPAVYWRLDRSGWYYEFYCEVHGAGKIEERDADMAAHARYLDMYHR